MGAEARALAMESMFEDDISILTQEALGPSEVWLDAPGDPSLGGDMCSASHFALITAYGDIKERLGGLERENATLRRRLKVYEIKVRSWERWGSGRVCVTVGALRGRNWGSHESQRGIRTHTPGNLRVPHDRCGCCGWEGSGRDPQGQGVGP